MEIKKHLIVIAIFFAMIGIYLGGCNAICKAMTFPDFTEDDYTVSVDRTLTYTGIIVDCRGLGLQKSSAPIIMDALDNVIYSDKDYDPQEAAARGVVSYAQGFTDEQGLARAGSFPYITRAIRLTNNNTSPVVPKEDKAMIEYTTTKNNYLKHCAVVFVR